MRASGFREPPTPIPPPPHTRGCFLLAGDQGRTWKYDHQRKQSQPGLAAWVRDLSGDQLPLKAADALDAPGEPSAEGST